MLKRLGLSFALIIAFVTPGLATGETTINVPASFSMPEPPQCSYPCAETFQLPSFIRQLNALGPSGSLKTDLDRASFLQRLEDWRRHAEIYRRSAEDEQSKLRKATSEAWLDGQVELLIKIAYYDELIAGYRNAHGMKENGTITFSNAGE